MATSSHDKIKTGWILRQTKYLKKWKKYWLTLSVDGYLRYSDGERSSRAEDAIHLPKQCKFIEAGVTVNKLTPPSDRNGHCLLKVVHREDDSKSWLLAAESPDDAKAWQIAMEEARVMPTIGTTMPRPCLTYAPPPPYFTDDSSVIRLSPNNNRVVVYGATNLQALPDHMNPFPGRPYVVQRSSDEYGNQMTTFIFYGDEACYCRRHCDHGCGYGGMATGMLAGAALGTMLFW